MRAVLIIRGCGIMEEVRNDGVVGQMGNIIMTEGVKSVKEKGEEGKKIMGPTNGHDSIKREIQPERAGLAAQQSE